jgi:hypothetical protein
MDFCLDCSVCLAQRNAVLHFNNVDVNSMLACVCDVSENVLTRILITSFRHCCCSKRGVKCVQYVCMRGEYVRGDAPGASAHLLRETFFKVHAAIAC